MDKGRSHVDCSAHLTGKHLDTPLNQRDSTAHLPQAADHVKIWNSWIWVDNVLTDQNTFQQIFELWILTEDVSKVALYERIKM